MRALFYLGDEHWSGCARAFLVAARGLAARGHPTTIACCGGTLLHRGAAKNGVETITIDDPTSTMGTIAELRRVLRDKFVEAVFVTTERDQFIVGSAMRLAERGAVIRRVPMLEGFNLPPSGVLTRRV